MISLKMPRAVAKAAAHTGQPDTLADTPNAGRRDVAKAAARPEVNPRVLAVVPPLDELPARILDLVLRLYEQQASALKSPVACAASDIMKAFGVSREDASAARAVLVGRGLLVDVRDGVGSFGMDVKPGALPSMPATPTPQATATKTDHVARLAQKVAVPITHRASQGQLGPGARIVAVKGEHAPPTHRTKTLLPTWAPPPDGVLVTPPNARRRA